MNAEPTMNFLILGDYGWNNTLPQKIIAQKMNQIAQENRAEFVISLGDNFYDPSGVSGINDPAYNTHWKNIFQVQPSLKNLKWYGVIGNHDFNGTGLLSEFDYKQAGWQIDDFFWSHKHKLGNQTISFVHLDTNFLAYGPAGQQGFQVMPVWFNRLGWKDPSQMVDKARQVFEKNKDSDWIISVGHHPIGVSCPTENLTNLYYNVIKQYNTSAYFHGHVHSQSFGISEGIGFYLSGAGGDLDDACQQSSQGKMIWSVGNIYGFTLISMNSTSIGAKYYYTNNATNPQWQIYNAPTVQRRIIK